MNVSFACQAPRVELAPAQDPVIFWCENERAYKHAVTLLDQLGRRIVVGRSVAETVQAILEYPLSTLLLVSFVEVPPAHAQAACRRFRMEAGERKLRLLALLEPAQLDSFDPTWGVDDFSVFPGDPRELTVRMNLIIWRDANLQTDVLIKVGPVLINAQRHEVLVENVPVTLTIKEYQLLVFLASSRDRVVTREAILDAVWGEDYYGGARTVDVHIRRLRAKLPPLAPCIETVHGVGYRFTPTLAAD
ncbi:MAG TPA: response regulator transcription factor [Armatimonadota bacterium]|jgi:DNA-binding response OmpR family regulator